MPEDRRGRVSYVIGPDGSPLTLADLPPPGTRRWVIRRKAEVVAAVRGGLLSLDDACRRYTWADVFEDQGRQEILNRYGQEGWELVSVVLQSFRRDTDPTSLYGYTFLNYYFKKEVEPLEGAARDAGRSWIAARETWGSEP